MLSVYLKSREHLRKAEERYGKLTSGKNPFSVLPVFTLFLCQFGASVTLFRLQLTKQNIYAYCNETLQLQLRAIQLKISCIAAFPFILDPFCMQHFTAHTKTHGN